jgi:hypothetical protein
VIVLGERGHDIPGPQLYLNNTAERL